MDVGNSSFRLEYLKTNPDWACILPIEKQAASNTNQKIPFDFICIVKEVTFLSTLNFIYKNIQKIRMKIVLFGTFYKFLQVKVKFQELPDRISCQNLIF